MEENSQKPVSNEAKEKFIEIAVSIADELNINLDFSHESIKQVDYILGIAHEEYKKIKKEEAFDCVALAFTAYIIAVIEKNTTPGVWETGHPDFGIGTFPYYWQGGTIFIYPWCMKRIVDGPQDDIWAKYQLIVLGNMGSSS